MEYDSVRLKTENGNTSNDYFQSYENLDVSIGPFVFLLRSAAHIHNV